VPYERRQEVLGSFIAGTLLGQSVGPLLGGVLSDYFGWRLAFVVIATGFLTLGLLLWPHRGKAAPVAGKREFNLLARYAMLLRRPNVRVVLAAVAAEGFLFFGAFGFLGAWLQLRFGLSYTAIGLIAAGYGVGGLAYSIAVRPLLRRLGERGLVAAGGLVLLGCFVGLALLPSWHLAPPLVVGLGFGYFMLHNTLQTRATEMAPQARGLAVSFFAMCLFLSQAAGVALAGYLVAASGFEPLFAAAGLGLALLAWWFRRRLQALS
jgi:predicted MFS family arabinose efflux permease